MSKPRKWTKEEVVFLETNYGEIQTKTIANKLNRSFNSVKSKAQRLGMGAVADQSNLIQLPYFIESSKISRGTLLNWEEKYGFPIRKKKYERRVCFMINPDKFWEWAKENKNMIEWDKFEKYAIGKEPPWVNEARRAAIERKSLTKGSMKKIAWTAGEDNTLKFMLKQKKYTYPEFTATLGRTHGAIKRRIEDLGIIERPIRLPNHNLYSKEEIETILYMYNDGHSFDVIAKKLNRSEAGVRGKVERMGYKFSNRVMSKQ